VESVSMILDGRPIACPVFERAQLPCGGEIEGPALVAEETATHLIGEGWLGRVDERGNLVLNWRGRS
jgi:N-methylhydantoinase A/oxoprolinase/acetone carboxylase beta subunit